jgi:hypothetical protein
MKGYIYHLDGTEIEVDLDGSISKYYPAVMYLRNGDPGYPEEGGELEDFTVTLDGKDITDELSKEEYDRLSCQFMEEWEDSDCEDYDD